jgi:hypothetical protein
LIDPGQSLSDGAALNGSMAEAFQDFPQRRLMHAGRKVAVLVESRQWHGDTSKPSRRNPPGRCPPTSIGIPRPRISRLILVRPVDRSRAARAGSRPSRRTGSARIAVRSPGPPASMRGAASSKRAYTHSCLQSASGAGPTAPSSMPTPILPTFSYHIFVGTMGTMGSMRVTSGRTPTRSARGRIRRSSGSGAIRHRDQPRTGPATRRRIRTVRAAGWRRFMPQPRPIATMPANIRPDASIRLRACRSARTRTPSATPTRMLTSRAGAT